MRWSQLRHQSEQRIAPSLQKRVRLFMTGSSGDNQVRYQAYIALDDRILWDFTTDDDTLTRPDRRAFSAALRESLQLSLDDCLASPDLIIRSIAMWDRRLGKRRIRRLLQSTELPKRQRQFLQIRADAEGLVIDEVRSPAADPAAATGQEYERAFLALVFDQSLEEAWQPLVAAGRQALPRGRWLLPADLHLTLHFLGSISRETAGRLTTGLAAMDLPVQPVDLLGVGAFPGRQDLLFWQVCGDWPGLVRDQLRPLVEAAGLRVEARMFHPHITLVRLPKSSREPAAAWAASEPAQKAAARVRPVGVRLLCRDSAGTDGRRYRIL